MTALDRIDRIAGTSGLALTMELRRRVFVVEQGVPEQLEWDGIDASATHYVARAADDAVVGCARVVSADGPTTWKVQRVAVRSDLRGRGVGRQVMAAIAADAERSGIASLVLEAQTHAMPFYDRLGYVAEGPEFLDAGIPHIRMTKHHGGNR